MFQLRAPMMVERVYEPATMKVSIWKKDMAIIAEFAADVGCATPMFTLTQPVYARRWRWDWAIRTRPPYSRS